MSVERKDNANLMPFHPDYSPVQGDAPVWYCNACWYAKYPDGHEELCIGSLTPETCCRCGRVEDKPKEGAR